MHEIKHTEPSNPNAFLALDGGSVLQPRRRLGRAPNGASTLVAAKHGHKGRRCGVFIPAEFSHWATCAMQYSKHKTNVSGAATEMCAVTGMGMEWLRRMLVASEDGALARMHGLHNVFLGNNSHGPERKCKHTEPTYGCGCLATRTHSLNNNNGEP